MEAFEAHASAADLDDLRERLAAARLPEAETVPRTEVGRDRWEQGVPLADLVDLVEYWRTGYDWRSFEERLNRIGQFRTTVDGLRIHFLHRRSARVTERIAAARVELMGRLGHNTFLAHGGDWGGNITTVLAGRFPQHVLGLREAAGDAPADHRLLARRLTGRASRLDPRQVRRVVRHRGRPVRDDLRGPHPRRRHPLLADPDGRFGRSHLPREPRLDGSRAAGRGAGGHHHVPA